MAIRTTVHLEDDLSGGTADETVTFGLDGRLYEIDLSAKNAGKLRQTLATYLRAGRRMGRFAHPPVDRSVRAQRDQLAGDSAAIRVWAHANGYDVRSRGRIRAEIREAYLSET